MPKFIIFISDDKFYRAINAFLLLKPKMDFANVPEFYKLFNSTELQVNTILFRISPDSPEIPLGEVIMSEFNFSSNQIGHGCLTCLETG